jgi:hypothetical protein
MPPTSHGSGIATTRESWCEATRGNFDFTRQILWRALSLDSQARSWLDLTLALMLMSLG